MNAPHAPLLDYPFAAPPAPGEACHVAPGVVWIRMPLPFALDHINLWLLAETDGWTAVDCGYGDAPTRMLWDTHFAIRRWRAGRSNGSSQRISTPIIWAMRRG
jgi:hypothetical protein